MELNVQSWSICSYICSQGRYGATYVVKVDIELYVKSRWVLSYICSQSVY